MPGRSFDATSTPFEPITARANFCAAYSSSLVLRGFAISANAGPRYGARPSAAAAIASSHVASCKAPSRRTIGFRMRRLSFTYSNPNLPLKHACPMFGGAFSSGTARTTRSQWLTSYVIVQPTGHSAQTDCSTRAGRSHL